MLDSSQFDSLLEQSLTEDQIHKIVKGLIVDASSDDKTVRLPARAELFNRLYGKPAVQPIDPAASQAAVTQLSDQELLEIFQKQVAETTKVRRQWTEEQRSDSHSNL